MAKKIKFTIKDKNTIVLLEDAKANDYIDISEISKIDKDTISKYLANAENLAQQKANQLYEQKIKEQKYEWDKICQKKDLEIKELKLENKSLNNNHQKDIENEKNKLQVQLLERHKKDNEKYQNEIDSLSKGKQEVLEKYNKLLLEMSQLKQNIVNIQNTKAMLITSTKSWGENLEKHIYETFESAQQNGAFINAHFYKDTLPIKDLDELKATKGDFIFRDFDDKNNEILSIEIEVKTEQLNSNHKRHNKDYYDTLDKNRKKKNCEYALLISELEKDNPNFDGIYKVHGYEKMYVVRPASFLSFINILKDTLKKNNELITKINEYKNTFTDQETFKNNLLLFQQDVNKSTSLGLKSFEEAIKYIEKTIIDLKKTKDNLESAGTKMRIANNKVSKITYKKLIKGCKADPFDDNN